MAKINQLLFFPITGYLFESFNYCCDYRITPLKITIQPRTPYDQDFRPHIATPTHLHHKCLLKSL